MPNLQLSLIMSSNDRSRPVIDGEVTADGIDLIPTVAHPSEMFWRQLHFAEFDISEMSMSSLLMAIAHGDTRWVGVPVFTSRRFFHTGYRVRSWSREPTVIARVEATSKDTDIRFMVTNLSARAKVLYE